MDSKRQTTTGYVAPVKTQSALLVDDELRNRLASVGPRARKIVSDGHLTAGTTIPSYAGLTVGPMDPEQIRQQYLLGLESRQVRPINDVSIKRVRDEIDEEDGDTEDDEESIPTVDYNRKIYLRPNSYRSMSSANEDFEEAAFLKPN